VKELIPVGLIETVRGHSLETQIADEKPVGDPAHHPGMHKTTIFPEVPDEMHVYVDDHVFSSGCGKPGEQIPLAGERFVSLKTGKIGVRLKQKNKKKKTGWC